MEKKNIFKQTLNYFVNHFLKFKWFFYTYFYVLTPKKEKKILGELSNHTPFFYLFIKISFWEHKLSYFYFFFSLSVRW